MLNRFSRGLLLLVVALALGCDTGPGEEAVIIVVGSRRVARQELKRDLEYISAVPGIPGAAGNRIRGKQVERLVDHYLILEYGKEKGIFVSEVELAAAIEALKQDYGEDEFREALLRAYVDLEQWKQRLAEQLCVKKILATVAQAVPAPTEAEAEKYFEENRERFRSPEMVSFLQIVTKTEKEAKRLYQALKKGEDMGELARVHSIAPEADAGGKVDWVARHHLEESMEKALFSLKEGQISPVTQTPYGYHIFKPLAFRLAVMKTFAEVKPIITSELLRERREAYYRKWLSELRNHYEVKIRKELLETL